MFGVRTVGGHLGTDRDRRIAVVLRVQLQRPLDRRVGAVGGDHRIGASPSRRRERHAGDAAVRVEHRADHFGGLRASRRRPSSACLSSRVSSSGRRTTWPWSGMPGRCGKVSSHSLGLKTLTPSTRWNLADLVGQAHLLQIAHRPCGQSVTARLVARELGLVEHDHCRAGLCCLPCCRRTGRPAADNCQVESLRHEYVSLRCILIWGLSDQVSDATTAALRPKTAEISSCVDMQRVWMFVTKV